MIRPSLLSTTALWSAALIGAAVSAAPALAQDTPPPTPAPAGPLDPNRPTSAEADDDGDIVVTGSRIRRRPTEFTSPDPIAVIDPSVAALSGKLDLAETLQSSSLAAGSTQINAAISSNFVTDGGEGAATISLRGLGPTRTLVLLNGRRAGPAGTRGGVSAFDLNVLPQSILQSIDILKTGASSVYGSDAVAGVVNFITKKETDGIELTGSVSVPLAGGGEEYNFSAAWGKKFDRGNILFAFDYNKKEALRRGQREYLRCQEPYIFKPNSRDRADLIDPRTGEYSCEETLWGHIWLYDYQLDYGASESNLIAPNGQDIRYLQFNYPGDNLGAYIPLLGQGGLPAGEFPFALTAPPGWYPVGYDAASTAVLNQYHPFMGASTFTPSNKRYTAYAQGEYEITNSITLYGEALHNRRQTASTGYRQVYQTFGFPEDFLGVIGDPLAPGYSGAVLLSPTAISDWAGSSADVKYTRGLLGARGDFGGLLNGWSWDSYMQYSRSKGSYTRQVVLLDAQSISTFRTGSCVGTTLPVSGRPCIDIPWTDPNFLAGNWTQAQRDFLLDEETGNTKYTQWAGEVSATGPLFDLPAGTVQLAAGLAWRRDQLTDVPGEVTLAGNAWLSTGAGITSGRMITKEAFGEIEIPLIHDTTLIKKFTLTGSGRVTSTKTTRLTTGESDSDNGNWTYRIGANWEVNDWLRFRGSYGTSFRSPAIFEQVLEDETGFLNQRDIDPCIDWGDKQDAGALSQQVAAACAAQGVPEDHDGGGPGAEIISSGGLGRLEAETSTSKVASVIFTPRFGFLPNTQFSLAVDWFDIKVKGEVAQLDPIDIVTGCLSSDFFPDDPLCDQYTRVPSGGTAANIAEVRAGYINVASQRNTGIDLTGLIKHDLGKAGTISLIASMTWQTKDDIELFPGTNVSFNGEDGEPKWVGDFNVLWETRGGVKLHYGLDVIGATSDEADYIDANGDLCQTSAIYGDYCVDLTAPARFYHNASITKEFDKFEVTFGVRNIFNTKPPRVSTGDFNLGEATTIGKGVFSSQYDYLGRRLFLNVKARF